MPPNPATVSPTPCCAPGPSPQPQGGSFQNTAPATSHPLKPLPGQVALCPTASLCTCRFHYLSHWPLPHVPGESSQSPPGDPERQIWPRIAQLALSQTAKGSQAKTGDQLARGGLVRSSKPLALVFLPGPARPGSFFSTQGLLLSPSVLCEEHPSIPLLS